MTTIGITGHRKIQNINIIEPVIIQVLNQIKESYPAQYQIISSLAEGSDCLLASLAIQILHAKLTVSLPLPVHEYLFDFSNEDNKFEFSKLLDTSEKIIQPQLFKTRQDAYLAAGEYVVTHCDILVAIWDGRPAQGKGGTEQIVTLARHRNLPVVWIHAINGNQKNGAIAGKQGEVTFERFPNIPKTPHFNQ